MASYQSIPNQILFPMDQEHNPSYVDGWDAWRDNNTRRHRATDVYPDTSVYVPNGVELYACVDGIIDSWMPGINQPVNVTSGGGYQFRINTFDGRQRYVYAHLGPDVEGRAFEAFAPGIEPGATVQKGDLVGWAGISGSTASGPHLHFEIRALEEGLVTDDPYANYDPSRLGFEDGPRYNPYPSLQNAESNVEPTPQFDPSNLMTIAQDTGIRLSWTGSTSVIQNYLVFRRTPASGGAFDPTVDSPLAIIPPTQTTYLDTSGTAGTTYRYQVFGRASN